MALCLKGMTGQQRTADVRQLPRIRALTPLDSVIGAVKACLSMPVKPCDGRRALRQADRALDAALTGQTVAVWACPPCMA